MKKLLTLVLALSLLCSSVGCAALFDKQYSAIEDYQPQTGTVEENTEEDEAVSGSISNYAALKRAITWLVMEHAESAELQFQNYDGTISQDISTACWEVKSSTALGAFAVDYISYDLSRIVSYYQAEVYITYKRSADQVAALEQISNMSALSQRLDEALRSNETYLVLQVAVASLTGEDLRQLVDEAYHADALACPVMPAVEVGVYPESGVNRIMEITLSYGQDSESLVERREALGIALDMMVAAVTPAQEQDFSPADKVYALCQYLAENCQYDPEAGTTAWDALAEQTASSEGLAMALEAGCQAMGVDCQIISGRMDGEDHVWNIITIDENAYHVDVSNWDEEGSSVFLVADEQLWGGYWWDTSDYPVCPEDYGYFDPPETEASLEPEPESAAP
jgi:hypothetical protein